jgi:hypothetical protein
MRDRLEAVSKPCEGRKAPRPNQQSAAIGIGDGRRHGVDHDCLDSLGESSLGPEKTEVANEPFLTRKVSDETRPSPSESLPLHVAEAQWSMYRNGNVWLSGYQADVCLDEKEKGNGYYETAEQSILNHRH